MKNLIFRSVTPSDIQRCFQIETQCFEPSEAATLKKIETRVYVYPEGFIIAELDGKIVGLINSGATDQLDLANEDFKDMTGHHPEGKSVAIFSVAIALDVQRKGVAHKMINTFIEKMKAAGKISILLICKDHLIGFYEKFGFKNLGKSNSTHGGVEWYEMELKLK